MVSDHVTDKVLLLRVRTDLALVAAPFPGDEGKKMKGFRQQCSAEKKRRRESYAILFLQHTVYCPV